VAAVASRSRIRHEPALDGLRGIAVAAVLLFHAGDLTGGYLGVDAFFVLSGFLITSLLLSEARSDGRISLREFWSRRARRLLPVLACVVLAVCAYAVLVAKPEELASIRSDAIATLLYVANWRAVVGQHDYWELFRSPSPLEHTWSLSIEEQFYVLWPLAVVALMRFKQGGDHTKRVLWTALFLAGASFLFTQLVYNPANPSGAYYDTVTRMGSILLGAALAALLVRTTRASGRSHRMLLEISALACVAGLAFAWTRLSGSSPFLFRGGLLLCAVATCVVIAAAVHPERGVIYRAMSWTPLCALGLISYGVYLWHWPVYVFLNSNRAHVSGWILLGVRVAVTLALAVFSYRFIERPVRTGTINKARLRRIAPVAVMVVAVAVFASTMRATPPVATDVAASTKGGILVVGDSVAASLRPGLMSLGQPVGVATSPGCRLINGKLSFETQFGADCDWQTRWSHRIAKQTPTTVLLMPGVWDLFDVQVRGVGPFVAPGTPGWADAYRSSLQAAVDTLSSRGAHIVLTTALCVGAIPGATDTGHSALDVTRVRAANAVVAAVAAANTRSVTLVDLFAFVCPSGGYQKSLGRIDVARPDGEHFTADAAQLIALWMQRSLAPDTPSSTTLRSTAARDRRT
jgi:peptidoglycan/LPS O-acetylase OafA/YrhL/lysophospholipase L1-like esterase